MLSSAWPGVDPPFRHPIPRRVSRLETVRAPVPVPPGGRGMKRGAAYGVDEGARQNGGGGPAEVPQEARKRK